jgi:poly-gamma-glutamate synthesis protein (capsule biosynthesis protein)
MTRILLAGDVMTGRGIDQVLAHPGDPRLFEDWVKDARDYVRIAERVNGPIPAPVAPAYPWGDALARLQRGDVALRIVNLETAVTRSDDAWPDKGINYRMHPANVDCLAAARLDGCALANNHVLDWGHAGLRETLQVLHAAGIATAGAGTNADAAWQPAVLPAAHRRVLLFSVATPTSGVPPGWAAGSDHPGIALLEALDDAAVGRMADAIARHRGPGDIVIVSIHWGGNWGIDIPASHRRFAHALIDRARVDIVHGHSSHHPLPFEIHRGRLVLYGCGDLLNDYEGIGAHGPLRSDLGCLYLASLAAGSGELQALEIVPFRMQRLRLVRAGREDRGWLEGIFGAPPGRGTRLEWHEDGWLLRR